ncbi:MAG: hypothetical protein ACLFQJ_04875 [Campylobacterales bacterium]
MAQEHISELRDVLNKELDEDTKAEMESVGLNLDKDDDIEKISSVMALFAAHEEGRELSEEQLEFVSGGNIFKKIWHKVKHVAHKFLNGELRNINNGMPPILPIA